MDTLQDFFRSLIESPELVATPVLYSFLSMTEKDFTKYKSSYEKLSYSNPNAALSAGTINKKMFYLKNPIKVEHLSMIGGNVECKISPELKTFSSALKAALKDYQPMMYKCKEQFGQMLNSLSQTKIHIDRVAESITALHTITVKFGDTVSKDGLQRWDSLETIFGNLSHTIRSYGRLD
jgi:hypothetical protein